MQVVTNEALIKKRSQFTQRGSLLGMGLLVVSLFLSTRNPLLSWLFLIVGFVVAMTAVRVGNRFVRPPRPDTLLDKVLKKSLDKRYGLYHYLYPAEHLLLTPGGLIAIRMQGQRGRISVRGDRWQQHPVWQRLRVLLGEVGLGNPAQRMRHELAQTAKAVRNLVGEDGDVPLDGIIVFYSGKASLDVQDSGFPVVLCEDLKAAIRSMVKERAPLSTSRRKALAAALSGEGATEEQEAEEETA